MRWADIRADERRLALGAFLTLLAITAAHTLIETARDALFLAKLPASQLPWVYLGIAAVGLAFSRLDGRRRRAGGLRLTAALLVSAAITASFWALSGLRSAPFLYALYLWTGIFASWVIVQFWLMLGTTLTVSQAKRLFSVIGTGSVLGAVIGAAVARGLAGAMPAEDLLVAASALLAITAVGPARLLSGWGTMTPRGTTPVARPRLIDDLRLVREHPYTKRLLLLVLSATLAFTLIDYLFKSAVAAHVPPGELAAFFANLYVLLNGLALMVQLFAVGGLLRVFGVHRVALLLPVLIGFGSVGLLLSGGFMAALILKGFDGTLRHSMHRTSTELLFVPLPDAIRPRAKPFIDLLGQRGGQALASVGILVAVAVGLPDRALVAAVVGLASVWVVIGLGIRRHYLDMFRAAIWEGRIDDRGDLPELDLNALEALMAALNSTKDGEVICALDLLAAQRRLRLIPALILYHPSRSVVLRALELFAREGRADFVPIAERLLTHEDADVRAAAMRARIAARPDEAWVRDKLDHPAVELRATALVSMIARRWLEPAEAQRMLQPLAAGNDRSVQLALVRAIALEPSPDVEDTLIGLLGSGDVELAMESAWALGELRSVRAIPGLIGLLVQQVPGAAARDALAAIGGPALEALDRALSDPETPRDLKVCLPRAIGDIPGEASARVLLRHLDPDGGLINYRVLRALRRMRSVEPDVELDAATLRTQCEETLSRALRLVSWRSAIDHAVRDGVSRSTPALDLIRALLHDKEQHAVSRMFLLLGLLHPQESFTRIHRGLSSKNVKTRASSRELVENTVAPALRPVILALIEDLPADARLERVPPAQRPDAVAFRALIDRFIEREDELGTLAHYHARELGLDVPQRRRASSGALGLLGSEVLHGGA